VVTLQENSAISVNSKRKVEDNTEGTLIESGTP